MRPPDRRDRRVWVRDPFLFALVLTLLGVITVALAVTGRLFGDPALIGLAVISVFPAFWLFYQRAQGTAGGGPTDPARRR